MTEQKYDKDISIVFANWNTKDYLRNCINSVYQNTHGVSYEIIVVDDGSTDGSVEMLKTEFPEVKIFVHEKNKGVVRAYNNGVALASGKYIQMLNSDMVLIGNPVKTLFDFLETHPDAAGCGAWLRNRDMTSQVSYGNFPSFYQAIFDAFFLNDFFPLAGFPNRGIIPNENIREPFEVEYLTGASLLFRKKMLDSIGFLDERYTSYCEETDFMYRVKKTLRLKFYFVPQAQIIHFGGASFSKVRKYQIQLMTSSYDKFLTKHHNKFYSICTRVLYAWHHGVKMVSRFIKFLLASSERKEERWNYFLNAWYLVWYNLIPHEELRGK